MAVPGPSAAVQALFITGNWVTVNKHNIKVIEGPIIRVDWDHTHQEIDIVSNFYLYYSLHVCNSGLSGASA